MSISSTVNRNDYLGTGAASTYSFTFKINNASDLRVITRSLLGVETTLVINTDYTVLGVGVKTGGTITLTAGVLANGVKLTIRRVKPLVQNADIRNQGDFYPETIEDAFDYLTTIDQQQQDHLNRALTLPQTFTTADFNTVLPTSIVGKQSVVLATNPTGSGLTTGPTLTDIATAMSLVPTVNAAVITTGAAVTSAQAQATLAANSAMQSASSAQLSSNYKDTANTAATNAQVSAQNSANSATLSQAQVDLAKQWATKTSATVDGTDYSAKYYAQLVSASLSTKVNRAGDTMTGDLALQSIMRLEQQVDGGSAANDVIFHPTKSNFKFIGGVVSIKGITPPNTPNGSVLLITNGSGSSVTVKYLAGVASDGINTGTGADLLMPADASLLLVYDTQAARWTVVGGSGAGGGSGIPLGGTTGQVLQKESDTDGDAVWATLTKYNIGLGNVDDTADQDKNVNSAYSAFNVTGIVGIANGGTGATDQALALTNLAGPQFPGGYLRSDGNSTTLSAIQAADVPTLNQNTTGNAATATSANTITGTLAINKGGTGQTTRQAALDALAGSQASGSYLRSNGTNFLVGGIQPADVPTLNQNTTGNAATATTATTATTAGNVTGTVAIANGGTGSTTQQAALNALSGTQSAGKYLRSDGTNTSLASIVAADVPTLNQNTTGTASNVTGTVAIANGGTGKTTQAAALTALAGTQTAGTYLRSDGTNTTLAAIQAADVPNLVVNTSKLANVVAPSAGKAFEISSTTGGLKLPDMSSTQRDAITTLTAGTQIYNNVTNTVQVYNGSVWNNVGSAAAATNFMSPGDFETGLESWYRFNDTSAYVDGVGGTPTGTLTTSSTGKLGGNSLTYTPGSTAFQGFSKETQMGGAYAGSVFEFSFYYAIGTPASYNDGDLKIAFYDIDNIAIITPIEGDTIRRAVGPFKQRCKVQLPAGYNLATLNIRASVYQTTTNTAYGNFYLEAASFSPQVTTTGFAASDIVSAGAVTIGATTTAPTKGTTSTDLNQYARRGDLAHIKMSYAQSATGSAAAGSGDYLFSLPPGLSFDPAKAVFNTTVIGATTWPTNASMGTAAITAGSFTVVGKIFPYDATRYRIGTTQAQTLGIGVVGSGFLNITNSPLTYNADFFAPIAGWSSNTVVSSDSGDGRLIATQVTATATVAAANAMVFPIKDFDSHNAYSTSTGLFTCPANGIYRVTANNFFNSATYYFYVYKNGAQFRCITYVPAGDVRAGQLEVSCVAGDTLAIGSSGAVGYSAGQYQPTVIFERLSIGSQQIAASEMIAALAYGSTQATTNGTAGTVIATTAQTNTHQAYSTTTGVFTCPANGFLDINAQVSVVATSGGVTYHSLQLFKNGTAVPQWISYQHAVAANIGITTTLIVPALPVLTGEQYTIRYTPTGYQPPLIGATLGFEYRK